MAKREGHNAAGGVLRGLAFVLVGVICAIMPVFLNDCIGYAPLFAYIVLLVLAGVYLRVVARALEFEQGLVARDCQRGEEARFELEFRNRAPLAIFRLELEFLVDNGCGDTSSFTTRTLLGPREKRELGVDITFDHVGVYGVGLSSVRVYDFLGLFAHTVRSDARCKMRVLPRVYPIERLSLNQNTIVENRKSVKSVLSDNMDYAYVRDYEYGDPMKTVHWKLSARTQDQLFTKLFEAQTSPGISAFLDLRCTSEQADRLLDLHDTLLEAAYSVLDYARHTGIDSSFTFRDRTNVMRTTGNNSLEALDALLEEMPHLGENGDVDAAAEMLERMSHDPAAQSVFILFTSEISQETVDEVLSLHLRKRSIAVFFAVAPHLSTSEMRDRTSQVSELTRAGVPVFVLNSGAAVGEVS